MQTHFPRVSDYNYSSEYILLKQSYTHTHTNPHVMCEKEHLCLLTHLLTHTYAHPWSLSLITLGKKKKKKKINISAEVFLKAAMAPILGHRLLRALVAFYEKMLFLWDAYDGRRSLS